VPLPLRLSVGRRDHTPGVRLVVLPWIRGGTQREDFFGCHLGIAGREFVPVFPLVLVLGRSLRSLCCHLSPLNVQFRTNRLLNRIGSRKHACPAPAERCRRRRPGSPAATPLNRQIEPHPTDLLSEEVTHATRARQTSRTRPWHGASPTSTPKAALPDPF
jgi:hypothetical protein